MDTQPVSSPDESAARVIRLIRPSLVVLCGPAACGKSTFAAKHFRPTQIVSSDHARALVCDDERDQRFSAQAFTLVHFLIEQRLGINRLCVVDSTALTPPARKDLLELARKHHVPAVILLIDAPLETCATRDAQRERTVGRQVIERQYQFFEQLKSSIKQEGFDQVIELRDEDLEKVRFEIVFRPVPRPAAPPERPERRRFAPRPPQQAPGSRPATREARTPPQPNGEAPKGPLPAGIPPNN
ncbi:MAG: AAA family ATPase [Terriglobia bacterium]